MGLEIEDRGQDRPRDGALVIALVNNMPDPALEATEGQFGSLLAAAAGDLDVRLRHVWLPGVPRGQQARDRINRRYFPVEHLLADPPDGLIVTGMEPLAASLEEEPYWDPMVRLLEWARTHIASSIWSCLAAHAAALAPVMECGAGACRTNASVSSSISMSVTTRCCAASGRRCRRPIRAGTSCRSRICARPATRF